VQRVLVGEFQHVPGIGAAGRVREAHVVVDHCVQRAAQRRRTAGIDTGVVASRVAAAATPGAEAADQADVGEGGVRTHHHVPGAGGRGGHGAGFVVAADVGATVVHGG